MSERGYDYFDIIVVDWDSYRILTCLSRGQVQQFQGKGIGILSRIPES